MGTENPIFMDEYRGLEFDVNCYSLNGSNTAWEVGVVIRKLGGAILLPERRDHDRFYSTYEEAREAGISTARHLIDQVVASGAG
ncbi:hypothetical protein [Alcaligenes faecalis]|uniref:hypothetical protein n=1 Tax=Alcaligenes faecalis TaxID=511 RepID=UPI001C9B763D|nr:hypothetical protein [Alcaligenes faecalis]MBY6308677.1 hypothetical protein [Alcaligenes faecalis]MBY6316488.1 hypothetical protein [Alcaligenes faecalis]MBY6390305.1 hypothetical protein [Alcaligenes faecalis]